MNFLPLLPAKNETLCRESGGVTRASLLVSPWNGIHPRPPPPPLALRPTHFLLHRYRIECLRAFLAAALGDAELKSVHEEICRSRATEKAILSKTVSKVLGADPKRRPLLPLVFQLVAAEDEVFGAW